MKKQGRRVQGKKTYDDISYEKRTKLLQLINEERWTIKSAAREVGIKLCTAKYILYQFRRKGRISLRRKYESLPKLPKSSNTVPCEENIRYIFVPYPVYIYCSAAPTEASVNSECKEEQEP